MSVRMAELLMGIFLLLVSIGLMRHTLGDNVSIGWIEGRGPGSGMWPFWLSLGMALSACWIILRWYRGVTPESRSTDSYIDPETVIMVGITIAAILLLLVLSTVIGLYLSMMLFLLFYVRGIGRHGWGLTISVVLGMPFAIYVLFEVALKKYLPRGLPFFENIFLHIDDFRYSIMS